MEIDPGCSHGATKRKIHLAKTPHRVKSITDMRKERLLKPNRPWVLPSALQGVQVSFILHAGACLKPPFCTGSLALVASLLELNHLTLKNNTHTHCYNNKNTLVTTPPLFFQCKFRISTATFATYCILFV